MYDLKDIEVKGHFGEKYRGKIQEVAGDVIRITYENAGDIICTVPIDDIFYAPYPIQSWQMSNLPELMPGTLVDVLISSETLPFFNERIDSIDPKAWWPAIVKKRHDDLIVVDLLDLSGSGTAELNPNKIIVIRSEIVEIDLARFRTESISFTKHPILSFKIEIGENYRKCFVDCKYEAELRRWCGEPVSFTKAGDSSHILVMSTDPSQIHRAKLIGKKWVQQWSAKYELTKQLEDTRNQMQPIYEDEFLVHQKLLVFALGADYGYLKMVSQLPDVVSAQLIDNIGKFSVVAKTESALKLAREKLEVKEEIVEFDRKLLGILLSANHHFFKQLVQWSALFRILIIGDDMNEQWSAVDPATYCSSVDSEEIALVSLTGTKSAIAVAKEMLEFAALNLDNLIGLKSQMAEMDNELLNDIRSHTNRRASLLSLTNKSDNNHWLGNGVHESVQTINGHNNKHTKSAWKQST